MKSVIPLHYKFIHKKIDQHLLNKIPRIQVNSSYSYFFIPLAFLADAHEHSPKLRLARKYNQVRSIALVFSNQMNKIFSHFHRYLMFNMIHRMEKVHQQVIRVQHHHHWPHRRISAVHSIVHIR